MRAASLALRAPEVLTRRVTFLGMYSRIFSSWRSRSMRRRARVMISVFEVSMLCARSVLFLNLPVPSKKRLVNIFPAISRGVSNLTSSDKTDEFDGIAVIDADRVPLGFFDDRAIDFGDQNSGAFRKQADHFAQVL